MPTVTTIRGGTAEFTHDKIVQEQMGIKAVYTLGNIQFMIFEDDAVVALHNNVPKIGDPISAVPPGTKGRIEKREEEGKESYVLILEEPDVKTV